MSNTAPAPQWAWTRGRFAPFAEASVPLEDRGLQFGEALYEAVAIVSGVPFRLADHVERMRIGAAELGLAEGVPPIETWQRIVSGLHRREPHREAMLYAQVTGGAAPRALVPQLRPQPRFFAYLRARDFPSPAAVARGIAVVVVPESRWRRRDLKTTMLLPAILARRAAVSGGAQEAVFVGEDGYVNEGAASTVFTVRQREVTTPPSGDRLLPGVSALVVEEICEELGVPFAAAPISLGELRGADEVFIASTSHLLMPVVRLEAEPVGDGRPGPVSLQLAYHFQRRFRG
jgi:D-alanine transaminase